MAPEQGTSTLTSMRWSDLVTAGHITWHLTHRHLAQALGRQDMRLSAADPTALRAGRLVLGGQDVGLAQPCLLYTSPSPRDVEESRMPSSA